MIKKNLKQQIEKTNFKHWFHPISNEVEGSLTIHQNTKISRIDLDENTNFNYKIESEFQGVYVMVIDGEVQIDTETLTKRDAIGIEQTNNFEIKAIKKTQLLFIEVPMRF